MAEYTDQALKSESLLAKRLISQFFVYCRELMGFLSL